MRALLPCPDLDEWLPTLLGEARAVAVGCALALPRGLALTLERWPSRGWPLSRDETSGLDALVRVHAFDAAGLETVAPLLDPGCLLVDLALAPKRPFRVLLGIADDAPAALREAEAAALALLDPAWVQRHVYGAHDPVRAVVTVARRGGARGGAPV